MGLIQRLLTPTMCRHRGWRPPISLGRERLFLVEIDPTETGPGFVTDPDQGYLATQGQPQLSAAVPALRSITALCLSSDFPEKIREDTFECRPRLFDPTSGAGRSSLPCPTCRPGAEHAQLPRCRQEGGRLLPNDHRIGGRMFRARPARADRRSCPPDGVAKYCHPGGAGHA